MYLFLMWYNCSFLDNNYAVNEKGQVRRNEGTGTDGRFIREHILRPWKNNSGYLVVCVRHNNKTIQMLVHRLVYCTINKVHINVMLEVHHKDGNKSNNCIDNLALVTRKENIREYLNSPYYKPHSKESRARNSAVLRELLRKPVQKIDKNTLAVLEEFEALSDIKRKYKYDISLISCACRNYTKRSAYGYYWKYL